MNETLETIKKRRSVRAYQDRPISDADLAAIMEAAIYAPSAMNQQKWHFTVIQSGETLDRLMQTARENLLKSPIEFFRERASNPDFNVFHKAPAVVIITADEKAVFTEMDCGMAAENIALAATSLGIASCTIGMSAALFEGDDAAAVKKELGIPEGYRFVISMALGYAAGDMPPAPPKNKENINYIK